MDDQRSKSIGYTAEVELSSDSDTGFPEEDSLLSSSSTSEKEDDCVGDAFSGDDVTDRSPLASEEDRCQQVQVVLAKPDSWKKPWEVHRPM